MRNDFPNSVPNYTQACVVMFGVNLCWILFAIWAVWGLLFAILFSAFLSHFMTRLALRAEARATRNLEPKIVQ
jgi:hypothetical protein